MAEWILNKCMKCEREFGDNEVNAYYVCPSCSSFSPCKAEVTDLLGHITYKVCVHCGRHTDKNCNGRWYECDDCHSHVRKNKYKSQRLDCTKLGMLIEAKASGMQEGRWASATMCLYIPHLTVSLCMTYEQMLALEKCIARKTGFRNPGKRHKVRYYKTPHHYTMFDFTKGNMMPQADCYFTGCDFGDDYGIGYAIQYFITTEGCLQLHLSGPQYQSLYSIAKGMIEMGSEAPVPADNALVIG